MNVYSLQQQFKKVKKACVQPSIIATLPSGKVEITPKDLLDYFIEAIRLGNIPTDHLLYPIFQEAEKDEDQGQIFDCLRMLAQGIEPEKGTNDLFLPVGKQAESILESIDHPKSINLWYGSVRSSKTIMSLLVWLWRCAHGRRGRRMMVGNTTETLELNCIEPLKDLLPAAIKHNTGWRQFFIFDKKVSIRGANDVGQEKKFRGPTLLDAYADEVTTWAKSVFKMLRTRMDKAGSTLLGTTNPDQPLHYIKTDYIDRVKEISIRLWHFVLDDNPGLTDDYKADLIAENPPGTVYYLRFILGLWVAAEGRVYNFLTSDKKDGYVIDELPEDFSRYVVAADYGQQHPTVFILAGYSHSLTRWVVIKEFYTNDKTNSVYAEEFGREILKYSKGIVPDYIDIDSGGGGTALIKELRTRYPTLRIRHAIKEDVGDEVQALASALFTHAICIYRGCTRTIQEMMSYLWDEKAKARGIDQPLKQNDDGCDSMRYLWNRIAYNKLGA